jgi:putative transposase
MRHELVSDGHRMRILVVVHDCTRECLLVAGRVAREFDRLLTQCGTPRMIVSGNGTELTPSAIASSSSSR